MIEQKQTDLVILEDGDVVKDSIKMSLDLESVNSLMQILSKNLYSDSIGSSIRETVSNALDSHRAAGVTDVPIIVKLESTTYGAEFSVEDFGLGLSHEDVEEIISKYGKSLKRQSINQLGMFGLGWKSPLAYVSSFVFITRKDGIERKYTMSEGDDGNTIDLLDENSTDSPNGVKIIIPVKYGDRNEFINKIKEQLCYFEDVYFNVSTIDNNFKITRYDDFQLSELNTDNNLHLCLDNVYYPLDFKKLGISPINIPVGLRFGLSDGILPTPNRESIRYSNEAKAIILDKIKKVATRIIEMYNETITDSDDVFKVMNYYIRGVKQLDIGHRNNIDILNIEIYSSVKSKEPKITGIDNLDLNSVFSSYELLAEYKVRFRQSGYKFKELKYETSLYAIEAIEKPLYKFSDRLGGKKKEYIKSIIPRNTHIIKKEYKRKLFKESPNGPSSYYRFLRLNKHSKDKWRIMIKEFQFILGKFEERMIDIDKIEIPKDWLDARKVTYVRRKNSHVKLEGEISCKKAENLERYVDGRNCKFVPYSLDLSKIERTKCFYIYDSHENILRMDKLFYVLSNKVSLVTFSEREIKKLESVKIHNLISYNEFMKGDTKIFKRLITAHLIYQLKDKYRSVFSCMYSISEISENLSKRLVKLSEYYQSNYKASHPDIYEAMLNVATEHSLFDYDVYDDYLKTKEDLEKLYFLNTIYYKLSESYHSEIRNRIIKDLCKYHKYKLNIKEYQTKEEEIIN